MENSEFYLHLEKHALEAGFEIFGAIDLDLDQHAFEPHFERYQKWIAAGHHGEMAYLQRGLERRSNPKLVFPEAESIFVVAVPYSPLPNGSLRFEEGPRYARYLRENDYHEVMSERLNVLMSNLKDRTAFEGLKWKVCVDTSAVLERSWAALCGLGWIGKNTLLIHPKKGSYLFLGEVLINQKTGKAPSPIRNLCGNCERCLKQCPTQALISPGQLNSNLCISYWTLEKRGELSISEEQKKAIGPWIAGCDLCQEACPFNLKPTKEAFKSAEQNPNPSLEENPALLANWSLLLHETEEEYKLRTKNSALNRVKPAQFKRNLGITFFNSLESKS